MSVEAVEAGSESNPVSSGSVPAGQSPTLLISGAGQSMAVHVINRSTIESNDVEAIVEGLNVMTVSGDKSLFRRLDWSISGYDHDSRELFEIPDVVAFVRRLDERWPYWGFYQHPRGRWVRALTFCLAGAHFTAASCVEWDPQLIVPTYTRWSIALAELCHRNGVAYESMVEADRSLCRLMDLGHPIRFGEAA